MMMAVSFEQYGRLYYIDPGSYSPTVGTKVLVPTDSGPEVAICMWAPQWVDDDVTGLPVCEGIAADEHLSRDEGNRAKRAQARVTARRLVRDHGLPMKVIGVDYTDGPPVFTVYFSAPHRVDFRALVRDLTGRLGGRVELRQIGPRDEARLQGGIGPCGRDLCCSTFLKDFEPVSVRMAKDQDLPVNPMRIAGACGRLMCCLKYEHPLYQDFREKAPKLGESVETPEGPGVVTGHNVPGDKVVVKLTADGRKCACTRASVCGSRQGYEARYGETGSAASGADQGDAQARAERERAGRLAGLGETAAGGGASDHGGVRPSHRRVHQLVEQPGRQRDAAGGGQQHRPGRDRGCRLRAHHDRGVLRAETAVAALRSRVPVRAAAGAVRLQPARLAAVLAAGGQAARGRPGAPDRVAGGQPRRPRRIGDHLCAERLQGGVGRRARPVRPGRVRPARGRRQRARRSSA